MRQERGTPSRFLRGRRVAVTRPVHQARSLTTALRAAGAAVLYRPLIRIEAPADPAALHAAAERAAEYDWLVFTSINAVNRFSEALRVAAVKPSSMVGLRIAAVGPGTSAALEASGFHVDLLPGEALAEAVAHAMAGASDLEGRRILWPRAREASGDLMKALIDHGAIVDSVEAYQTIPDGRVGEALAHEVAEGGVDVLTFTSPSAVRAYAGRTSRDEGRTIVAVIGPVTAAEARAHDLAVHVEASPHTVDGMVAALRAHFGDTEGGAAVEPRTQA